MEIKVASQFEQGYVFRKNEIIEALTPEYLAFLREADIADITKTPNLFVAKSILRKDVRVEEIVSNKKINCKYDNNNVVSISQPNSRKLVYSLGCIILPTGIMYKLVIPSLKQAAKDKNESAKETLEEMTQGYAEWLEDRVLNYNRLLVGSARAEITLPKKSGEFDRADINEFGYPTQVKAAGEFYHWHVSGDERAAIRCRYSGLDLNLDRGSFL